MKKKYITFHSLLFAIVLIAVGLINRQNQDVLMKAVRICLECVGIG